MDLCDNPKLVGQMAARVNRLLIEVLDRHFALISPNLGGYGHIFGYWAPDKTIAIQEDTMCMCASETYRELFWEHNAEVVRHLGCCVLFHMHSVGCQHYRDVLALPGLAGIQMTMDPNGPKLADMLPVLRDIMEHSRLILWAKQGCQGLPEVLGHLPKDGLYVIVPDADIGSDASYRELLKACYGHQA